MVLDGSTNTTVGGTAAGAGNLISGNAFNVALQFSANNNFIQGNLIGTNASGTAALSGSPSDGIFISASTGNVIGGTSAAARNVISGNTSGIGISLGNMADNNTVQGNFIGTDITGTIAVPNLHGVHLNGSNNVIGGTTAAARNVISGNTNHGISLFTNSGNNTVQGNFIGTQVNGTSPLPNTLNGVNIAGPSSNNAIGGTAAGAANTIAFNGGRGINVVSGTGNGLLANLIFSNAGLGIDLNNDGVTANDAGDADSGPNNLQNFPALTSATPGAMINIQGTLNSTASTAFRIEFFANVSCDASGNGEGTTFLGSTNVNTDGGGNATINVSLPVSVPAGNVVVATATDPANNTSEFSACVTVGVAACMITCPPNQTASNAPNQCGATVSYPPPTTSGSCGAVTCVPPSGSFFPGGTSLVNCTTAAGPSCSFNVTVNDTQPPTITCPPDQSVSSAVPTVVNYPPPTRADNCSDPIFNCVPPSGSVFAVGTTPVNCTATDASLNTANCSFNVTVTSGCAITCPPNQTASSSATQCGAAVSYPAPTTSGPCGPVSCVPASGSFFAVGTTNVTCTAGASPSCSFSVTVVDDKPPLSACPQNLSKPTDPGKTTAVIDYAPATVSDNCPGATVVCLPPSGFTAPLGTTTVTCTAKDASNNAVTCSFTVTVTDAEPPGIRCPAGVSVEVGPNQASGVVTYPPPAVGDNLPNATVVCAPPSGAAFPLGVTTVTCTARDAQGNQASCGFTVTVLGGTPVGRIILPGGGPVLEFGEETPVAVSRKPPKSRNLPCGLFSVQNTSLAPLRLTLASINRVGADVDAGRISDAAEGGLYQLSEVLADGSLVPVDVGSTVTIAVGAQKNFCLKFGPSVPALAGKTTGLRAPQAIPDAVDSRVSFSVAGAGVLAAGVMAQVETAVRLINLNNPKKLPAVSFSSSGDEFRAGFAVFDSNMDVSRARYELLSANGQVIAGPFEVDLAQPIRGKNLVRGQSFSVEQRFTGARSHPEIKGVRVTVFDGETDVVGSTALQPSTAVRAARFESEDGPKVVLPVVTVRRPASDDF